MFRTLVLRVSRETHVGEAARVGSASVILRILREHGPINKNECWRLAEDAGVKSKRHMKLMLRWLKDRQQVQIMAQPKQPSKEELAMWDRLSNIAKKKKRHITPAPVDKEFLYDIRGRKLPEGARVAEDDEERSEPTDVAAEGPYGDEDASTPLQDATHKLIGRNEGAAAFGARRPGRHMREDGGEELVRARFPRSRSLPPRWGEEREKQQGEERRRSFGSPYEGGGGGGGGGARGGGYDSHKIRHPRVMAEMRPDDRTRVEDNRAPLEEYIPLGRGSYSLRRAVNPDYTMVDSRRKGWRPKSWSSS
eukprot:TRINITY_DN9668_c0_g1_i1.p1 TRINITY_DN9668_c0_g1~~TRINITY_DN9668_c0_g1_i1.p1  ORF type:complete len:351 (-),score=82.65 TRINITY_DN9668_c0_g1_i1:173-1093(-)